MFTPHSKSSLYFAVVLAVLALVLTCTQPVRAEGDTPVRVPVAPEGLPGTLPASPADLPVPADAGEAVQALTDAGVEVATASGESLPLASQTALEILSDPDPWFFCADDSVDPTPGDGKCSYSGVGAIAAAANDFDDRGGSGMIYVEAGAYAGAITINASLPGMTTLTGLVGDGSALVTSTGNLSVSNRTGAFTLKGMYIAGGVTITGGSGALTLTNVRVLNAAGTGITINQAGNVTLNQVAAEGCNNDGMVITASGSLVMQSVVASRNGDSGAIVSSGGALTVQNGAFSRNDPAGINGDGHGDGLKITAAGGNLLLDNIIVSDNNEKGIDATLINGTITLKDVYAADNTGGGAYLNNRAAGIPKAVLLQTSTFNDSDSGNGLYIMSFGSVTVNNISASQNGSISGYGAYIDNCQWNIGLSKCDGSGPVLVLNTLGDNYFEDNASSGLRVVSKSAITLNGVHALSNGDLGAYLENNHGLDSSAVTVNKSFFNNNDSFGIEVQAHGNITLNMVTASRNTTDGDGGAKLDNTSSTSGANTVSVMNGEFIQNAGVGLTLKSDGTITLNNVTANKTSGTGTGATIINNTGNGSVNVLSSLGDNVFENNLGAGLQVASNGKVTLQMVNAVLNGAGGAMINASTGTDASSVTISNSRFDTNSMIGLAIGSHGSITLTNISASYNPGASEGAHMEVLTDSKTGAVTIIGGRFDGNADDALIVKTPGRILVKNITAIKNGGTGVNLDNCLWDGAICKGFGTVIITAAGGMNLFNDNAGGGLIATSSRSIAVNAVQAMDNLAGVVLGNSQTGSSNASSVVVTNSTFDRNTNWGIAITSHGTVTISKVNTVGNWTQGGLYIRNSYSTGFNPVTISGGVFSGNNGTGLYVESLGSITVSNAMTSYNTGGNGFGMVLDNCVVAGPDCTGKGAVKVLGTSQATYNARDGVSITSSGAITVTGITVSHNTASGASLTNNFANAPESNSIRVTNGFFDGNGGFGLAAIAKGSIIATGVHASNNLLQGGIILLNTWSTTHKSITASNLAANGNTGMGIDIESKGTVTLTNLIANGNTGGNGWGIVVNNCQVSGPNCQGSGAVNLLGKNQASDNGRDGLYVTSNGGINVVNLTASNNDNGATLENNKANTLDTVFIKVSGSSFDLNSNYGLAAISHGNVLVNKVTANGNLAAGGIILEGTSNTAGTSTMTVTNSDCIGNIGYGLQITTKGGIMVNNVTGSGNSGANGYGAVLDNTAGSGSVSMLGTMGDNQFIGNSLEGLHIETKGAITLNTLTASRNGMAGVNLNNAAATMDAVPISVTSGVFDFNSSGPGLYIIAHGRVTINKILSNGNFGNGIYIDNLANNTAINGITVSNAVTSGNNGTGLWAKSDFDILVNHIHADGNFGGSGYGVQLDNTTGTGNVSILSTLGRNTMNGNAIHGVYVISNGNMTLNGVSANSNGMAAGNYSGAFLVSMSAGNINILNSFFIGNNRNGIRYTLGTGTLTLTSVVAFGNDALGGAADPDIFETP